MRKNLLKGWIVTLAVLMLVTVMAVAMTVTAEAAVADDVAELRETITKAQTVYNGYGHVRYYTFTYSEYTDLRVLITDANALVARYDNGETLESSEVRACIDGLITGYTKFSAVVLFNASANGGKFEFSTATVEYYAIDADLNAVVDLTDFVASKEGYEFIGWSTDVNGKSGVKDSITATGGTTLYAIYRKQATNATFQYYSGSNNVITTEVAGYLYNNETVGTYTFPVFTTIAQNKIPVVNSKYYSFSGWRSDDAAEPAEYDKQANTFVGAEGQTFYAVYTSGNDPAAVATFDTKGGSAVASVTAYDRISASGNRNTSLFVFTEEPTLEGFVFRGWATANNSDVVVYKTGDMVNSETSMTLYAVWECDHTGGTASCTVQAVCEKCGDSYGDLAAHNFLYGYLDHNDTHHWYACPDCNAPSENKVAHSLSSQKGSDASGHWDRCYLCNAAVGNIEAHTEQITNEADGTHDKICTVCSNILAEDIGHELTYTASGNVITESCERENCSHTATATISAEDTVYNGQPHPATVICSEGWKGGELTVSYEGTADDGSDYAVTGPVSAGSTVYASISIGGATAEFGYSIQPSYVDVGTVSVVSPTTVYNSTDIANIVLGRTNTTVPGTLTLDAGQSLHSNITTYNWTFTPDDTVNYLVTGGTVSITVIQDAWVKLEIVTPPTKTTYTYGESFDINGIKVVATWLSGRTEEILYKVMDGQFTPDELTVATTEVSCTLTESGNEFTITQKITVNPKVVTNPTIKLNEDSYRYTGQPIEGVVYEIYDGGTWIAASEYTVEITNNTDVGTATVTIVDVAGGNYDISGSIDFYIVAADITDASVSQTGSLTYTGNAQTPTVNASATTVDGAAVTFTYSTTQDGTYTAELPTFTNAGTYTVYFKANAANHNEAGGFFEIVVGKATNEWTQAPAITGWTYGEFGNEPTATPKFGEVGLSSFSYRLKGTVAWTNNPPSDAGIYELRTRVQATDNWELLETTIEFEIKKATPTADLFDFTPPANLDVCDGLAKEATVTVKEGIEGVGSITIKYFKGETELSGAPTTVGTYTVKIEVAEGANYNATQELTVGTFTFDITDEAAHTGVTLVSNGDGTHDKVCSVCEKVIESNIACSGTATDDCDKGYKCSCGGYFGTKEHDFSGEYLSDADGHWHECLDCGAAEAKTAHTPENDDGSCLTAILCSACDYETTKGQLIHNFNNANLYDESGHWHKCERCDVTAAKYDHSFTVSGKDGTHHWNKCEECDATDTKTLHTFNVLETDDTDHWHKCSGCDATDTKVKHSATEDGDCTTEEKCSCGTPVIEAKNDHDFSGAYSYNDEYHWKKCQHCDVTSEQDYHNGQSSGDCTKPTLCACGYVVLEAKEHSSIAVFYTDDYHYEGCLICTMPVNDVRTPHDFSIPDSNEYDHWNKCSGCDKESEYIPHSGDNGGDCTKDSTCSCGYVTKVAETSHDFGTELLSDAEGHYHKCKNCDVIDEKVAHTPDDDRDCLTDDNCTACGYLVTKGQLIHNFNNANLYDESGHWHKCERCDVTAAKYDHSFTVSQKDGTHHWNKCEECDATDTKTLHTFNVLETDDTDHWHKCSGCDATDTKVKHSATEDGDCTTEEKCSCGTLMIEAKDEHGFDNSCDTTCGNKGCTHTREITHTPRDDDGDCTTAIHCFVCEALLTPGNPSHDFDNACDTDCNRTECNHIRTITHTPNADDGNCTTAILCSICNAVTTAAKNDHGFDNSCDTTCGNKGCTHTREITHTLRDDDGDCTTAIHCSVCDAMTTPGNPSHDFDNACDTDCNSKDCTHTREITHTPTADDEDCSTAIHCSICNTVTTPEKSHSFTNACDTDCNNAGCKFTRTTEHSPEADDNDCTTDILCSVCDAVTTKGNESHTGGTATCTAKAECSVCGTEYGDMLKHTYTVPKNDETHHWHKCSECDAIDEKIKHSGTDDGDCTTAVTCSCGYTITEAKATHTGGTATCTAKAECSVCGTKYGEMLKHSYTVPQHNETQHWNKCATCDDIDTKVNHNGVATCIAKAHCTVCDIDHGVMDATNHAKESFVYTANTDGTTHTKKHECCLAVVIADEAHTFGDDDKCVCGTAKPVPTYTVTVENGTVGEGSTSIVVNENGSVTVSANAAPEGKRFKGWSVNGEIVSTDETYTFNATEDIELKAVYEDVSSGSEDTPSTGDDNPSTGDDNPSTGEDDPSTGDTDVPPAEPSDDEDGLSTGAIVAIVIACVVALAGGGFALYWFVFKKKKVI